MQFFSKKLNIVSSVAVIMLVLTLLSTYGYIHNKGTRGAAGLTDRKQTDICFV